jgi:hypothetical protein
MAHLRAGWLVVLCGVVLAVSAWLPWLTTPALGGGRASAIGGTVGSITMPPHFGVGQLIVLLTSVLIVTGAMVARNLSPRLAALAALTLSVLIGVLVYSYYQRNVNPPVSAGYGFYIGAGASAAVLLSSVWALISALVRRR